MLSKRGVKLTYMKDMRTVGQRVTEVIGEADKSVQEIADIIGVSAAAIYQWQSDATKNIRPENLFPFARAVNVNAEWIATGEGPKKPGDIEARGQDYTLSGMLKPLSPVARIQVRAFLETQLKLAEEYPEFFASKNERSHYKAWSAPIEDLKVAEKELIKKRK